MRTRAARSSKTSRRFRLATYAGALTLVALLAGCGGDDETSAADEGKSDESAPSCVGKDDGTIEVGPDKPVKLPGGSKATLAATDMEQDPPTVSFELGRSTDVEQQHASDLAVGDKFGVARGVYVVARICADEAVLGEF